MAEFYPIQLNRNNFLDYCDSNGVNPNRHFVLRNFLSTQAYSSPNTIATVEHENNLPHHIAVLTTSDLISDRLQIPDANLLIKLREQTPTTSVFDYLRGIVVETGDGRRKLKTILAEGGLNEKQQSSVLSHLHIQPIKRGNILLAVAEDEEQLQNLNITLGRVAPVVVYRTGLTLDFINGLILSIRS